MKAVVTVIGKDQKGIIAKISNILFENGVNILDISQTIMQDMFTMIMLVNFENDNVTVKQISEKFEQAEKDMGLSNPCAERRNLHINAQNIREVQIMINPFEVIETIKMVDEENP